MTEREWLRCGIPDVMLSYLKGKSSERKLRLFGVECGRRAWDLFPNETCRRAILTAERFADGLATDQELAKVERLLARQIGSFNRSHFGTALYYTVQLARWLANRVAIAPCFPGAVSNDAIHLLVGSAAAGQKKTARKKELADQCASLRDIFGNPFRPVTFDPDWRTTTALALAKGIYDERAFDRLPILADALQDAGCDNDDILTHLRATSLPHVRGCWALDLVLGKE